MEADLVARIVALAIDGVTADQVSWDERRKGAPLPAIILHQIAPGALYSHEGRNALAQPRLQATILAASPAERQRVADAVQAGLEPAATVGATAFGEAFLIMAPDLPVERIEDAARVFGRALDFELTWHPA